MRYKEHNPRPKVCENCPECSIKACLDCEHFQQRYEIDELDWLNEAEHLRILRSLLEVDREEEYHIIRWKPCNCPPVEDNPILLLICDETFGHYCTAGYCRKQIFWLNGCDEQWEAIEEESIRGWDYFPYDEHANPLLERVIYKKLLEIGAAIRNGELEIPVPEAIKSRPEL